MRILHTLHIVSESLRSIKGLSAASSSLMFLYVDNTFLTPICILFYILNNMQIGLRNVLSTYRNITSKYTFGC